jgi:hypothetical protein
MDVKRFSNNGSLTYFTTMASLSLLLEESGLQEHDRPGSLEKRSHIETVLSTQPQKRLSDLLDSISS